MFLSADEFVIGFSFGLFWSLSAVLRAFIILSTIELPKTFPPPCPNLPFWFTSPEADPISTWLFPCFQTLAMLGEVDCLLVVTDDCASIVDFETEGFLGRPRKVEVGRGSDLFRLEGVSYRFEDNPNLGLPLCRAGPSLFVVGPTLGEGGLSCSSMGVWLLTWAVGRVGFWLTAGAAGMGFGLCSGFIRVMIGLWCVGVGLVVGLWAFQMQ